VNAREPSPAVELVVGDRRVRLMRPEKVLYRATGFTKLDLAAYLIAVAPALLPHLAGRAVTLARFPDGVDAPWWFQANCPAGRPAWIPVAEIVGARGQTLRYCRLEEPAALAWAASAGALELHPFLAPLDRPDRPAALVLDLDPAPPAGLTACCALALELRAALAAAGLSPVAKTSGAKGLHLYAALDGTQSFRATRAFARALAERLAAARPDLVTARLAREARPGRVLVDWRQNAAGLSTVAPYSLRGTPSPRVSTPLHWDEVEAGAAGAELAFGPAEVLTRVAQYGDLFAGALRGTGKAPEV
jgi:bifunctional non-homologous end joining protein LigD